MNCNECEHRTECNECDLELTCEEFLEWIKEKKNDK